MTGLNPVGRSSEVAANVTGGATPGQAARAAPTVSRTDLALDIAQIALDLVGIVEPTPVADLTNAGISVFRGDGWGALGSLAGVVPYVGDAAKLGKLGKWAQTISNAVDLARRDPGFAAAVRPALEKVQTALQSIPQSALDALPTSARQQLSRMSRQVDEALGTSTRPPSFVPSRTSPTGQIDGTPVGRRATNEQNADPGFKRGIARENQSADILAAQGYRVEQNPVLTDADRIQHGIAPGKNPDYRIEGRIFDGYAPQTTTAGGVYEGISGKVSSGQAHRIVVNLGDSPVRPGEIQQALRDNPIPGLQEVIIIDKGGTVHKTFPN